jgi:hypothetical protein
VALARKKLRIDALGEGDRKMAPVLSLLREGRLVLPSAGRLSVS